MSDNNEILEDPVGAVVTACRVLGDNDLGDMVWGHVSVRDPDGRGIWMKPHMYGFEEIEREQVLLVTFDGDVLEGKGRRHGEYPIHTEIMRARPDVHCVVHTHPIHAVAFAATERPLRPISHDASMFTPPDIPRFTLTGDLIVTRELGEALARTLGDRPAALMPHHGIAVAGPNIGRTMMATVLLERACKSMLLAGDVKTWSPDEEALSKRNKSVWVDDQVGWGWDYLVRKANRGR